MNNWIQNIKGQLSELATEVLQEATEEGQVSTSSELQVEKKKSTESERLYLAEKAQREALERRLEEMENQLLSINMENDAIKEKFMGIVSDRDQKIAQLNRDIERLKYHQLSDDDKGFRSIDLDEAGGTSKSGDANFHLEIEKLKEKHEHEISMIMSVNAANVQQIREEYEQRIHELQSWNITDEKLLSAADDNAEPNTDDYSKLLKDFTALKQQFEANEIQISQLNSELEKKNQQISELQIRVYELQASFTSMEENVKEKNAKIDEAEAQTNEIRRLKILNSELMSSFNEAREELEELKKNGTPSTTASDLSAKIASLKSMLNETETRYELCKMEQNETSMRLENLLKEFANLRSSMQAARATAEGNEQELMTEVISLRDTLEKAKDDRERLIGEFRDSMRAINEELSQLRECNRKMAEENTELGASLSEFESLRDSLNASNNELSGFREKFSQMQSEYMEEIEELKSDKNKLLEKLEQFQVEIERDLDERREMTQQIETLKVELKEREEELHKLKAAEKLLMANIHTEEFKRPSSDTEESAASNNDWERMGKEEIDVEGVSSGTNETKESHHGEGRKETTVTSKLTTSTQSEPIADFEEERRKLEEKITQLEQRIVELQQQLEEEQAAKDQLTAGNIQLEQRLNDKDHELISLREEITAVQERNSSQNTQLQDHRKMSEIAELFETNQLQLKNTMESNNQLASANAELLAENERIRTELEHLMAEATDLRSQLRDEIESRVKSTWEAEEQIKSFVHQLEELTMSAKNTALEEASAELEQKLQAKQSTDNQLENEKSERFSVLMAENEELKMLLQKKHVENQEYYTKLQEIAAYTGQSEQRLQQVEEQLLVKEQEIASKNERMAKLESELTRLREHLLVVEEMSSKEAESAEERETELRRQIRQLQEKYNNDESSVAQCMERYQQETMEYKEKIASLENECLGLHSTLEDRQNALKDANKALSNLQIVLKDLAEDQRREKLQMEEEIRACRKEIEKESAALLQLQGEKQILKAENEDHKSRLDSLHSQLEAKNALLEEIENQLEEVRTSNRDNKYPSASTSAGNSYKIDDSTLRQLFLSYFTAERSKQSDIAIVMSKILGYTAEEQAQIQKALQSSSGGNSWFGFGGSGQDSRKEHSLTEQFIRFLEQESVTNAQPMLNLPQNESRGNDFLVGESLTRQASPSSTDLKSILDSS